MTSSKIEAAEMPASAVESPSVGEGIEVEHLDHMMILRQAGHSPTRRILYLNSYGMASIWRDVCSGAMPGAHLWGCLELVRMGYEIAMPWEPKKGRFFNYRRQDLRHVRFAMAWLGNEGIVYSAHTILFWLPLLASLRLLRCPVVTLLYARGENIRFSRGYQGVLALNPSAESRARELAPHGQTRRVGWGVDLPFFPVLPYTPRWFLNCGKTRRDFRTLAAAAAGQSAPVQLIQNTLPAGIEWPSNVQLITGGRGNDWQTVSFSELIHQHYAGCIASLIILQEDSAERFGAGFSQLLEAMALARPVIVTRTGGLAGEVDVEKEGCGLFVPPNDPAALAKAMQWMVAHPSEAEAMGHAGRHLCEEYYNMGRFGNALDEFFGKL